LSYSRLFLFVNLIFSFTCTLSAQALFSRPVKVLGDPEFVGTAASPLLLAGNGPNLVEGREISSPLGVALDTSVSPPILYIADAGNNRVLGFQNATQMKPGSVADVVLGQVDRFSNLTSLQNGRSSSMNAPSGLAVDSNGILYVADTGNNRILRYTRPFAHPAGSSPLPDMVIGQTSLAGRTANAGGVSATSLSLSNSSTFRSGLAIDSAGNLWVADTGNNRVLRFPAAVLAKGQNGPAADLVIGQADFITAASPAGRISPTVKTVLVLPQGLAIDPAGRLLVSDSGSRVLVYAPPFTTNQAAVRILGVDAAQTSSAPTAISVNRPLGVAAAAAGVIVPDTFNNRLLVFPTVDAWVAESTQFSPSATAVIGQVSYTVAKANQGNGDASASSFNTPVDAAATATEVYVADAANNRVLVFSLSVTGLSSAATRLIGQLDFPYFAVNLIEGHEFSLGSAGAAILDQSATPSHLYVADSANNRILGFQDFAHLKNGQNADLVIGQPDLLRNQINYPSNDAAMPNQSGLHLPTSLAVDSAGNLYVADTGNSRVLRFPAPFASGKTALEDADLVIGQQNFTTIVTDPTAATMSAPGGIALTADAANAAVASGGWLVLSDNVHARVLFFQKPFSNGMNAAKVLGSPGFTSVGAGSSPDRFSGPRGVAVDPQDRVMVADAGNHRVQIFNAAAGINTFDSALVSLTQGLNTPVSIASNASGFWVADGGQNTLVHFPAIDQLGLKNNASDATQAALQPLSAFVDSFANLLVTDSANRVLYFAPQVTVVSSASYSPRALAAGLTASIFPAPTASGSMTTTTPTPNVIAAGTATSSVLPLPTTLADTQVLVNNNAAPLFYVSPAQINMVLSNSLPTGGTADLQVVRQSTGQVYGGAELQLASADPALFTLDQSGTGPVAAINVSDGSVNSPTNPVLRGQFISLYGTGIGPVTNAPPDGQAPSGPVPAATLPQVVLGTSTTFLPGANVTYSGLAPGLVGVWQINVMIPADAPTGNGVAIKLFQNSISSLDAGISQGATTIAIK
jgi:uncharacterized protein (TIGR03437 family)